MCYCTCDPGQSLDKVAQEIVEKDVLGLKQSNIQQVYYCAFNLANDCFWARQLLANGFCVNLARLVPYIH